MLGLASSGLHSNGFSLVRRVVETAGLRYDAPAPFAPGTSLGEALLTPTRLYVRGCRAALAAGGVKAFAHITGGGLVENIPRVLPDGLAAELDARRWPLPPVFRWLAETAGIARDEMARTFNCGIGMVAVVAPDAAKRVTRGARRRGRARPPHRPHRRAQRRRAGARASSSTEAQWPG